MTETLTDPKLPAHQIITHHVDGSATRNDGVVLQVANANQWYVLATIYGEQDEAASWHDHDKDLAAKNRRAWNLIMCAGLTQDQLDDRAKTALLDVVELMPLPDKNDADTEQATILTAFKKRLKKATGKAPKNLPDTTESTDFSFVSFERLFVVDGFVFKNACLFRAAQFHEGSSFSAAQLCEYTDFRRVQFFKRSFFNAALFHLTADFSKTRFYGDSNFSKTQFHGTALFSEAQFFSYSHFPEVKFYSISSFREVQFHKASSFSGAQFQRDPSFYETRFEGVAVFSAAEFFWGSSFRKAQFLGDSNFRGARFHKDSDFSSAKFKKKTMFSKARFLTSVPQFHAAELYDDTVFPAHDQEQGHWPPSHGKVALTVQERVWDDDGKQTLLPEYKSKVEKVAVMEAFEQKRAYNRLRQFMSKSIQVDEELFFHRMEMRCKTVLARWYHKPLYHLFSLASDFGGSVVRPMFGLLLVILMGAAAKLYLQDGGIDFSFGLLGGDDIWAKARDAGGWSVANTMPFLGLGKLYFGSVAADLEWPLRVVGAVQTVLGYSLLFLFGLGIRNRFRLR